MSTSGSAFCGTRLRRLGNKRRYCKLAAARSHLLKFAITLPYFGCLSHSSSRGFNLAQEESQENSVKIEMVGGAIESLEKAGYMLRPRYHSDRKPSWAGTDKFYLDFEDGQQQKVSIVIFYR